MKLFNEPVKSFTWKLRRYLPLLYFLIFFGIVLNPVCAKVYRANSIEEANKVGEPGDTVFIKAGIYDQTLIPLNSGEEAKYISYIPEGGDVIIEATECGVDLRNKSFITIVGLRIVNIDGPWINMEEGSHNNIIENCYMEGASNWSGIGLKGASFNRILSNTMIATCPCEQECLGEGKGGPHDLLYMIDSHHNLIEGNKMYDGIHDNIDIQDHTDGTTNFNIIRNNFLSNKWHGNFDIWGVDYMLIENNTVVDGGEYYLSNFCSRSKRDIYADRYKHKGIFVNTRYSIVRYNTLVNNGGGLHISSASSSKKYKWKCDAVGNRLYNNTATKNQYGVTHNSTDPSIDNVIKNNIFYDNDQYAIRIFDGPGTPSNNFFINNNIKGGKEEYSISDTLIDNVSVNPYFVDENNRDFRLKPGSPMIDAGAWLTTTVESGENSKKMKVDDAGYFMDGWGVIEGDMIQLQGQKERVRIIQVNYENNVLYLEQPYSWQLGEGVALPYNGERPDIGSN